MPSADRASNRFAVPAALLIGGVALAYRERRTRRAVERVAAASLETLLNAIEANDEETGMHVRRVAAYALVIAQAAGLDERRQRAVERIALFHDIGKIHEALFDIVHEGARLTPAERRAVATHPRRGADVLAPLASFYPDLPRGVLSHHERWDGTGYPRGLRGTRIPLEARIVTIADTLDAVSHHRRYRRGSGINAALRVIEEGRGQQFDPSFVDLVLLPPVIERLVKVHGRAVAAETRRQVKQTAPAPARRRERVPDVTFRWRSESLGSRRVHAAQNAD